MNDIRDAAASYYTAIDRSDVDHVLGLFAEEAVYDRAGVVYPDLAAIRRFFTGDRQISGAHAIEGLWSDEEARAVFVIGRFVGKDAAGNPRAFGFADVWTFDAHGRVTKRQSYLATG